METTKENGLIIFQNEEFGQVRSVTVNGEPWFVGKDVATILGYSNPRDALARHTDDEDKNTVVIHDGTSGNPNVVIINESGLYSLILSSKLPDAKKFKRWVTSEILPALRKTGTYSMQNMTVSDQIKLLAEGYSEVETRLEEIQGVTQDLNSRVEHIEKTLDVLESNNNAGKLLNLKRAVVAKSYELTAGNWSYVKI